MNNKILNTSSIYSSLYQNNPRMIPSQFTPECRKRHIVVLPETPNVKGARRKKGINKKNEGPKSKKNTKSKDSKFLKQHSHLYSICTRVALLDLCNIS